MINRPKNFTFAPEACIACGTCVKVCPTHVLKLENRIPFMLDLTGRDYWNTCWECRRCLAVCPNAAISVCGKKPENSLARENMPTKDRMKALIANRRSIRHFKDEQAPHIVIPHAKIGRGEWVFDTAIAFTYLELLMTTAGLGTIIQSFPRSILEICPDSRKALGIPDDHYFSCFLSFGYPEVKFRRGVQRQDEMNIIRVKI